MCDQTMTMQPYVNFISSAYLLKNIARICKHIDIHLFRMVYELVAWYLDYASLLLYDSCGVNYNCYPFDYTSIYYKLLMYAYKAMHNMAPHLIIRK